MSIADRIQSVKTLPKVLALLVYGRSGTGKTTFSSSLPKPILLIDVREKGTDSISQTDGVDVIRIDSWADFEEVYWYVSNDESKYASVVIDQVSSLQDLAMEKVMEDESKDAMSQRLWGTVSGMMKTWLLNYRDLIDRGINICFIAHDKTSKEGDTEEDQLEPLAGPRLMPSVAGVLNGAVTAIGSTYIRETFDDGNREVEYRMRLGPHAHYVTKLRNPMGTITPESILNPTFDKIMNLIINGVKPAQRKVKAQPDTPQTSEGSPESTEVSEAPKSEGSVESAEEKKPATKRVLKSTKPTTAQE